MKKRRKPRDLGVRIVTNQTARPTLVETVDLSAMLTMKDLDAPEVSRFRDMLVECSWAIEPTVEKDTLEVNYRFDIEYFGRVEGRIRAWIELIRSGAIVKADFQKLTEARVKSFLIVELMDELIEELRRQAPKATGEAGNG